MVLLCRAFFTPAIIRAIRSQQTRTEHNTDLWEEYRTFHHTHLEKVSSKNAMYILNEFQHTCETISTFPTERYTSESF